MISPRTYESNLSLDLTFPETNQPIRVVGTAERPEWVAKDVCDVLGIANVGDTLNRFDDDERGVATIYTPGGRQEMLTVTEPGLYRMVLKSRKPAAQAFKRWVLHKVLPSIRAHGCYPPPPVPKNPTSLMLRQLADSLERQDQLEIQQAETARKLDQVTERVRDMDGDTGYITVLAYGRMKKIDMPCRDARRHGKALSKIHRKRGIRTGWVPDERYGRVRAYRIDVVEKYFARLEGEAS